METIKSLLWKPTPEEQVGHARLSTCAAAL